jgi:glycosyltransferase involved in cell wall biosynthesis
MVITYSIKPNIYAGYACRQQLIPYCVNVQGLGTAFQKPILNKIVGFMYRKALASAKVVFFENKDNADLFRQKDIVSPQKICVLNGAGVNLNFYYYQKYPSNQPIRFLYLGRLMKEKGIDELFTASERLFNDGIPFVLDIVGFFEDKYSESIKKLQNKGIVVYHGFQADPRLFYAQTDCVILPSYHEGMNNVLLESSAVGRPIITSDICGCREAVNNGKNGILCAVGDSDGLYDAMKHMALITNAERSKMGKNGRAFMEAKFDKNSVVKNTIENIFR